MKKFYLLIIALVFALCACSPDNGGDIDGPKDPDTEQTNPENPGDGGGSGEENGDKPGNEGGENGDKPGGEGGDKPGEGEGGSEGEEEPLFEIVEPERTVGYDSDSLEFTIVYTDKNALAVTIDEEKCDWLTFSGVRGDKIYFWVTANRGTKSRTGEAVVEDSVSGKSVTVRITQLCEQERELLLTPQSLGEIEACGGVFDITLEGYIEREEVYIKYDDSVAEPDWCYIMSYDGYPKVSDTGLQTDCMYVSVLPNLSTEARSVNVTFRCAKYDLTATLVISQKGYVSDGEQTQLHYTTTNGKTIDDGVFDVPVLSNTYSGGQGVITFDGTLRRILRFSTRTLKTVIVPDHVEELGNAAFSNADNLEKIVIGSGVKEFGYAILWGAGVGTDLEVELNSNVGIGVFDDSFVTSIIIGSNVTEIGEEAFYRCQYIEKITFNEGLKRIGKRAFRGRCFFYKLPNSLEVIGEEAFYYCDNLIAVSIGKDTSCKIKEIGVGAFYDTGLTTLVCYATTPPKYGDYALYKYDEQTQESVPMLTCPIFVPQTSWNTYKSAAGWKVHSTMISVITQELENGMKDWE